MSPLVAAFIGLLARAIVLLAAGYGLALATDDVMQALAGLATFGVLAWSSWRKYRDRQKLVTALASDSRTSEREVEFQIQVGNAASVLTPKNQIPQ